MVGIDRKTIRGLVNGDDRAFSTVIDALQGPVYRFALKLCGNREAAEDITQETFVAIVQSIGSFKGRSRFKTWVFGIAYRQFLRYRGKNTLMTMSFEDLCELEDEYNAFSHMESAATTQSIRRAIDTLPAIYREVVFLVFIEGLKYREASQVLDVPVGTIKSRMSYAFNILREKLKESEVSGCEV